ncbi:hypothetical protein BpHYR1_022769, partial [Brachionus plicatilis]
FFSSSIAKKPDQYPKLLKLHKIFYFLPSKCWISVLIYSVLSLTSTSILSSFSKSIICQRPMWSFKSH